MLEPLIRQLALTFCVYETKRSARVEKSVGDMVVRTKNERRLLEWGPQCILVEFLSCLLGVGALLRCCCKDTTTTSKERASE